MRFTCSTPVAGLWNVYVTHVWRFSRRSARTSSTDLVDVSSMVSGCPTLAGTTPSASRVQVAASITNGYSASVTMGASGVMMSFHASFWRLDS